jgi:hypothetical protein
VPAVPLGTEWRPVRICGSPTHWIKQTLLIVRSFRLSTLPPINALTIYPNHQSSLTFRTHRHSTPYRREV